MGIESNITNTKSRPEIPQRLWLANEVNLKLMVKEVRITGKENIKEIPPGAKVVIMTTHLTDLDIPVAIHAVARDLDLVVTDQSTHHKFFGKQGEPIMYAGLQIAGRENFLPLDYERGESGEKSPKGFNPENFKPMMEALEKGKSVLMAAHNPSKEPLQNLDNVRGGRGGVYLTELTDAYILPITVVLDRATGIYETNSEILKNLKNKPTASVVVGKPFKLEKIPDIEAFSELAKKENSDIKLDHEERKEFLRLAKALREQSQVVIKKMSEQLSKQS